MTVAEAIRAAAARLEAVSDTPRLDAELLMAHALGVSRSDLLLRRMGDPEPEPLAALLARRAAHEPVAYILGVQEFYGLEFEVTPATLIPRADSETLIEAARIAFADRPPKRILDLGTGSGALLLSAMTLWPDAQGLGVDRDPFALVVALRNAERVGVNQKPSEDDLADMRAQLAKAGVDVSVGGFGYLGRARFNTSDWTKRGWSKHFGTFDLILANPPYVENDALLAESVRGHEPAGALFAGPEGLDDYRVLVPQLPGLLAPGGVALVEIGFTQAAAVTALAEAAGFVAALHHDLGNRPRALELRKVA